MIDARALPATPIADFINSILRQASGFTTLVVCSSREKFLEQLTASVAAKSQEFGNNGVSEEGQSRLLGIEAYHQHNNPESPLYLLSNTINALVKSRRVKLVFCSSLAHLRAHLSTFQLRSGPDTINNNNNMADPKDQDAVYGKAMIAILDLVAMHCLSTEFSAQGLSRTLALAIETAARTESDIMLCECSDAVNVGNPDYGQQLWDLHVPLLNGGTIRSGNAGRHVSVRRVAQRWFRFEGESESV